MKKPIPVPAIVVSVVAVLAVAGYFLTRGDSSQEFAAPKTGKVIPRYVWDTMSPKTKADMEKDGYTVGDVTPTNQPSSAPGTPSKN